MEANPAVEGSDRCVQGGGNFVRLVQAAIRVKRRARRIPARAGLLGAGGEFVVRRVAHSDERQTLGWRDSELARAGGRIPEFGHSAGRQPPVARGETRPDEGAHHRATEGVGPRVRDQHPVDIPGPGELLQGADGGRPLPGSAERREVVQAEQAARSPIHRVEVESGRMPHFVPAAAGVAQSGGIGDAVLVPTPGGREPGVESGRRERRSLHLHVTGRTGDAVEASHEGVEPDRRRTATARAVEVGDLGVVEVDVGDLPRRVYSDVGATSDGDDRGRPDLSKDRRERSFEFALHGAEARLFRPAVEVTAVVGEVEPDASHRMSLPHRVTLVHVIPTPLTTFEMTSPPSLTASPDRFRVPGLDGIRALAVTTVIVFHLVPGTLIGGYLGVDIFFVVSGFLITTLLLRERAATGRISLRGFWTRRARRLLPALGILLLACCSAALFLGGDVLVGLGTQVVGATTFSSNWLFIAQGASYFDETVPELFRNLWSLAVEEQFYVVWPLLAVLVLVRIPRWAKLATIGAIAVASAVWMAVTYSPIDPTRVYYGTDTHAFGLAVGAFLAVLLLGRGVAAVGDTPGGMTSRVARWTLGLTGTLAVAALVALSVLMSGDSNLTYRGGLALVAVLSAVAIAALLVPGSLLGRALDLAPIRWVGLRSYGLYLWHWPVFVLVGSALPTWPREGLEAATLGGIALAITVVAAALSYRFIEQPIRRHGFRATARAVLDARPRSRRAFGAMFAMVLVTALSGTSVAALVADPGRGEAQAFIEAGQEAIDAAVPAAPAPAAEDAAEDAATTGDGITAIGDSVLLAAAPAMQAAYPGIAIDASVSRSMYSAPAVVQAHAAAGTLRPVVVIALGTNGPIERSTLEEVRRIIGPGRELVVVNAQAPRGWIPGVNAELSSFALVYRNVELANWHDAIQPYLHEMARDQVHFGPIGAGIFAAAVSDAVDRLAALPPLRDESADLSLPTPF